MAYISADANRGSLVSLRERIWRYVPPPFRNRSESAISALVLERDSGLSRFLWAGLALSVFVLAWYGARVGHSSWEIELQRGVQASSPAPLQSLAEFMTAIGHSPIYPATAALGGLVLLLWLKRPTLAAILVLAAVLRSVSPVLKAIVDRERPSPLVVNVTERLSDPSFPSGHVLGATLLYGFLIYAVEVAVPVMWLKRACQAVLASMIVLMGYARVELGAHWPTDVLAGWAVGTIVVLLLVKLHRTLEPQPK